MHSWDQVSGASSCRGAGWQVDVWGCLADRHPGRSEGGIGNGVWGEV